MAHFDAHNPGHNIFYWIIWGTIFVISKAAGVISSVSEAIQTEAIHIPHHNIWWLPQLHEFIPALIVAGGAGIVSFIVNKLCKIIWLKLFPVKK
jgi:hypothetical protein